MKKYRLKKYYPTYHGLLLEESIAEEKKDHYEVFNKDVIGLVINKNEVENNPEFWEKVEEKEYEILSFRNKLSGTVFKKLGNGNYGSNDGVGGSRLDDMFSYELCDIHSVKRLSDGEVFTIGDRIDSYCESGCITEFEITENNIKVHFLDDKSTHQNEWTFLNNTIKPKRPLFTTEDGVDIYEGDVCYSVVAWCPFKHRFTKTSHPSMIASDKKKYFSTEEKTWEWIKENKPKYSKKDIEQAIDGSKCFINDRYTTIYNSDFWRLLNDAR